MSARYPIVHVVWTDCTFTTARWQDREDVLARIAEQWAEPIHTAGFLVDQDGDRIVVCAADSPANDDIGQCVVIPRHAIKSLAVLERAALAAPQPEAPPPLDVERLSRATIRACDEHGWGVYATRGGGASWVGRLIVAEAIAAEYARLATEPTP